MKIPEVYGLAKDLIGESAVCRYASNLCTISPEEQYDWIVSRYKLVPRSQFATSHIPFWGDVTQEIQIQGAVQNTFPLLVAGATDIKSVFMVTYTKSVDQAQDVAAGIERFAQLNVFLAPYVTQFKYDKERSRFTSVDDPQRFLQLITMNWLSYSMTSVGASRFTMNVSMIAEFIRDRYKIVDPAILLFDEGIRVSALPPNPDAQNIFRDVRNRKLAFAPAAC